MHITVTAKPKKKKEFVQQISPTHYIVSVKEPPQQGRANQAIIKALAQYFDISQSDLVFVTGQTSKIKIFDVPDRLADFEVLPSQKKLF